MNYCTWGELMKTELKTAIIFGVVIIIGVSILSVFFSSIEDSTKESLTQTQESQGIDKSKFRKSPGLVGITHYLNTTPEELRNEMKNKVILYDIWTYTCINCVRTLPYITEWDDKYSDQGLLIIGVHSPEFEFEKNVENVKMAITKHGIEYPVVLDNNWDTWNAFENHYWPRKYVVDHEGYIRYDHIGEGAYKETEKIIQKLLKERAEALGMKSITSESLVEREEFQHTAFRTPELYFGYELAQGRNQLGNEQGFKPDQTVAYDAPQNIDLHKFYLTGKWYNFQDGMRLESEKGSIKLLFHAKEVNIVTANMAEIEVYLDGSPLPEKYAGKDVQDGILKVREPSLYNVISSETASTHELELRIKNTGFEIFTFTFG